MQTFLHPIFQKASISVVGFGLAIRELLVASLFIMTLKWGQSSGNSSFSIFAEGVRARNPTYLFG